MGNELGRTFYALWQEVALLFRDWGEFVELFTKQAGVELLNKAAPVFFRAVQIAFFETTVLRVARLTDPPKSAGKTNLTIQRLPALLSHPSLTGNLNALIEKAKTAAEFCRDWRNRQLAHSDLDLALGSSVQPLETATVEKMKAAITALADVLNALSQDYVDSTTLFELTDEPGGARALVRVVKDGLKLKAKRQEALARGEPTDL
jgi:hypothetical protein